MIGDEIIQTQEDVQLLQLEDIRCRLDLGQVEHDVQIVAPIIDLGDMAFLECVLDGQRMEMKDVAEPVLDLSGSNAPRALECRPREYPPDHAGILQSATAGQSAWRTPVPSR